MKSSCWPSVLVRQCGHDAADLGEAAQPADQGIARVRWLADVVCQFMAVIGSERNTPIGTPAILAAALLGEQHGHHGHHIVIAAKVVRLLK